MEATNHQRIIDHNNTFLDRVTARTDLELIVGSLAAVMQRDFEHQCIGKNPHDCLRALPSYDITGDTRLTLETVRLMMTTVEAFRVALRALAPHYIRCGTSELVAIHDVIPGMTTFRQRYAFITCPEAHLDPQSLNLGAADAVIQTSISGSEAALVSTRQQVLQALNAIGIGYKAGPKSTEPNAGCAIKKWQLSTQPSSLDSDAHKIGRNC